MSTHFQSLNHLPTLAARPDSRSLDLMFLLDTICSEPVFEERCKFIRDIIRNVVKDFPTEGRLRVGMLPYGPHLSGPMPFAKLTTDIRSVQRFLQRRTTHPGGTFEAAYEEALLGLYNLDWGPSTHRVMVTIGHRPPHPYYPWSRTSGDPFDCYDQQFCEKNFDWRLLLAPLRSYLRLHSIVVLCPSTWPYNSTLTYTEEYANYCWKEIGYTSLLSFDSVTAGEVASGVLQLV